MTFLEDVIERKNDEVRTDTLDLTFGEIANLYYQQELVIQPEYKRLFRWSEEQKSRLIESIILELPIPQIFIIENNNGTLELIDGLQRICSFIQFINSASLDLKPLVLQGCDIIPDINGMIFEDLPLRLKLRIKRSVIRTVIIKKQNHPFSRYVMFKRLHWGGSILSSQELRNCLALLIGDEGVRFHNFLQRQSYHSAFINCTETLSDVDKEQRGSEELVLRFLASKNALELFRGSVQEWLDEYMENILSKKKKFEYEIEEKIFNKVFTFLSKIMGSGAFVKYRDNSPIGGLIPTYYEAISVGTLHSLKQIIDLPTDLVKQRIIDTVQTEEFRQYINSGANRRENLHGRINTIKNALLELVNE